MQTTDRLRPYILTVASVFLIMENIMRIDKFLKVSRLIKRRSVANEACDGGRISLNGKIAKAGDRVKVGDIIELSFGDKTVRAEILNVAEHVTKDGAAELYRII